MCFTLNVDPPNDACAKCPNCSPQSDEKKRWGKYMLIMDERTRKLEVVEGEHWINNIPRHCVEWIMWI